MYIYICRVVEYIRYFLRKVRVQITFVNDTLSIACTD